VNREAGYTLLETLVAFAILASVIVALYAAGGLSLRLIGDGRHRQQAILLAQSKLDEVAARGDPLPREMSGTFAGSDLSWVVEARDLPAKVAGISPYRLQGVRLIVSWPSGAGSRSVTLETRHLGTTRR